MDFDHVKKNLKIDDEGEQHIFKSTSRLPTNIAYNRKMVTLVD